MNKLIPLFDFFSAFEVSRPYHTKSFGRFDTTSLQEIMLSSRFFAVKRRAVFILGAMWWALVRGWRRDCVVGGMETRFQWREAHSRTAKCEAFHIAPRLFFMFLFLIPFTIRQHCIIYPQEFSTVPMFFCSMGVVFFVERWGGNKEAVSQRLGNCFCDLESSG